jgi:hypothetical protein
VPGLGPGIHVFLLPPFEQPKTWLTATTPVTRRLLTAIAAKSRK